MKKSINQRIVTFMMAIILMLTISANVSFAKTKKTDTNTIGEQQLTKILENDDYIVYEGESSGELNIDILGSIQSRAIPNHVGSRITKVDNNRVKIVSTNYGVDTVDRVRINATGYNIHGFYCGSVTKNEYNIRPMFYRTNIFKFYNWRTVSINIEVWDGGQYGSKFVTIVNNR